MILVEADVLQVPLKRRQAQLTMPFPLTRL